MRRSLPAVALLLLVALAPVLAGRPAPLRAATPGAYIALGDSIAFGIGSSLPRERAYPVLVRGWLQQQLGGVVPFTNLAVAGETADSFMTAGQLDRLREQVARNQDAGTPLLAVTLTLGGNELLGVQSAGVPERQTALDAFSARFPEALGAIRAVIGDSPLIVTTYYDPTGGDLSIQYTDSWWIAQFNAVIIAAAGAAGATVADLASLNEQAATLTRYPLDVHPTNAGHEAIARIVWAAMGVDVAPPTVEVLSAAGATRRTPTLRLRVTDPTGLRALRVRAANGTASQPVPTGGDQYVVLLDFTAIDGNAAIATIEAIDQAGNTAQQVVEMTLPARISPNTAPNATPGATPDATP